MKKFVIPEAEIIYFIVKKDIITSSCVCDACTVCPEGKNDCRCWDFAQSYTNE